MSVETERYVINPGVKELFFTVVQQLENQAQGIPPESRKNHMTEAFRAANMEWAVSGLNDYFNNQHAMLHKSLVNGMTRMTMDRHAEWGKTYENGSRESFRQACVSFFEEVNNRFRGLSSSERKKFQRNGGGGAEDGVRFNTFQTHPEFVRAVYERIAPRLLFLNKVGKERNSGNDNNSFDEVADVVETIMHAVETGRLVIVSQMCAQYNSGADHSADSFTNGLAQQLDPQKVAQVFAIHREVVNVCSEFGIEVQVISPQVTAHGENIPALVPATFWEYAKNGRLAEMFMTMDRHSRELSEMVPAAVGGYENLSVATSSLAERATDQVPTSIATRALEYSDVMRQVMNEWRFTQHTRRREAGVTTAPFTPVEDWMDISVDMVQEDLIDPFDRGQLEDILAGYSEADRSMIMEMIKVLAQPNFGTLEDTATFYRRYEGREIPEVDGEQLYAELVAAGYAESEAASLVEWSQRMARIQIGSRAIYNTALYFALGEQLARLNTPNQAAVMLPVEEDRDRWGVMAINSAYQLTREQLRQEHYGEFIPGSKDAPVMYPEKAFRQPLAVR